ncbi:MAG: immunoglobulin-like domain-containing protein [Patescibacteria group bacterium]
MITRTQQTNSLPWRTMFVFFAIFLSAFFIKTPEVKAQYNLGPDVSYSIVETSGYDGNLTMQQQSARTIHYVVQVINNGPGPVNVEKAAFASPNAGWAAVGTDEFLDQSLMTMTGKTHYEEGESGQVEFFYNTAQKNCGSVQIDAGFRDPNNGNFVFIGTMINYGVDCPDVEACNETATVALTGPANVTPGQSVTFSAHIENTGNTRWYHGTYFQFVQTTGYTIAPTYGHYSPSMFPGDERDFSFTFTAPTTPGTYTINMQNVHRAGADYQLEDGTICDPAPSSDVYFGQVGTYTFTVGQAPNNAPVGNFDEASCSILGGWAFDPDHSSTSLVFTFFHGGPEGIGTQFAQITANSVRTDVNTQYGITGTHGFTLATPQFLKDGNTHEIWVYATDIDTGVKTLFTNRLFLNTAPCMPNAPTVTLTANPTTVTVNGSSTLTWTSTNATSCVASADWSGSKTLAGSELQSNLTTNKTYTITCTGPGGSATATATVTVVPESAVIPVVTAPACSATDYSVQISWAPVNASLNIFIDDNGTTSSWWKQGVDGNSGFTAAPAGFLQRIPNGPTTLTFAPGTTHSVFIHNNGTQGPTVTWNVPTCTPANTPPVLTLVGPNPMTIVVGTTFVDPGATAHDQEDGNITANIVRSGSVDSNTVGVYTLTYNVSDSQGLAATPVSRTVNVVPAGNNVPEGFVDEASCSHIGGWAVDGDSPNAAVTIEIYKDGPFGTGTLATTTLANQFRQDINDIYGENHAFGMETPSTFRDGHAHTIYVYAVDIQTGSRTLLQTSGTTQSDYVTVTCNTRPVITLIGANPATFYVGDPYVELGATAHDNEDGNITSSLVINSSNVNTSVPGTYTVTYNVQDSAGLAAVEVSRTVIVLQNPANVGSIRVCLILANENNVVATSSAGFPAGVFSMNLSTSTNISGTSIQSKTWTTATFNPNSSFILAGQNDADCTTYNNIAYGTYYYSQLSVTGANWLAAQYNDNQSIHPINNVFDFALYSDELFNSNPADDAGRNFISDGQIIIDSSNQNKTLVIFEKDDAGQVCTAPQITSPLVASVLVGQPFTYTVTATSSTPVSITVTNLPAGLTFSTTTNTISGTPTTAGTFNINLLAVNNCIGGLDAEVLVLTVTPPPSGSSANLSIVKTSNQSTASVGGTVVYTITVVNNGPSTANNVVVTDNLPGSVRFVSSNASVGSYATSTGLWTIGSLANGASATLTISITVNTGAEGREISNTATVTANEPDPNTGNNTSTVNFIVNGAGSCSGSCGGGGGSNSANLGITKTVNKTNALPGETVIYTINVINYGPNSTTGVTVNDIIPNTLNFISYNASTGSYNNTNGVWDIGNLSNGSTASLTITATVKAGISPQTITNTATVTGSVNDQDNSNNTSSASFNSGNTPGNGPITPPGPNSCMYLLDYLRADFNNNPVEVIKLQVFLKELEGFTNLQITGIYDAQTIVALDAFQNRYASEILTPWGHTAPTSYTYILTKKKVNEIYCRTAFPVTTQQQQEIDNFRNFLLSLQSAGVTIPNNTNTNNNVIPPIIDINNSVGVATSTNNIATSTTTPGVINNEQSNLAFAFGAIGDWMGSFCGFLNLLLLLIIAAMSYLWYKDKKRYEELERINKEIDLK